MKQRILELVHGVKIMLWIIAGFAGVIVAAVLLDM